MRETTGVATDQTEIESTAEEKGNENTVGATGKEKVQRLFIFFLHTV